MMKLHMMLLGTAMLLCDGCRSLPSEGCLFGGTVVETRAHLDRYDHVILVCVTEDHVTRERHPARSDLHFTGTVVRVYKGNWSVSETLSWTHDLDDVIPIESNKYTGDLFFVFTDTHSEEEIFLDTGDWPRWDKKLAEQIEIALR